VQDLRQKAETELLSDILPFWLNHAVDDEYGGFRGQIANDLTIDSQAAKGVILNARILWTFSKAFSVYANPVYLEAARRAYEYLIRFFWDDEFGGVYWMVDYLGRPWTPRSASMRRRSVSTRSQSITTPQVMPKFLHARCALLK
jgi:mannobiose 2-epimerase